MGADKADLIAPHVVSALSFLGQTTILGRTPIPGCAFLADQAEFEGPLPCLTRFAPSREWVFVASCDLVLLRPAVVTALFSASGLYDAVIPTADAIPQYLCGLYRATCFEILRQNTGLMRVRDWTEKLNVNWLSEGTMSRLEIVPEWCKGANTPEELAELQQIRQHEANTGP